MINNLEYLAGIIDGEGTIDTSGGSSIRLRVGNTNTHLMDWLKDNFGGNYCLSRDETENNSKLYEWSLSGKSAYKVLKKIAYKLLLKREQAIIDINLYERVTRWNFRPLPLWAKLLIEESTRKLHALNKKGVDIEHDINKYIASSIDDKLSYLAGIIDGEGTIGVYKYNNNYKIELSVGNSDVRLIKFLEDEYGGGTYHPKKLKGRKSKYNWQIYGKHCYRLLNKVRNKLLLKREQAGVCIRMYERVTRYNFGGNKHMPVWAKNIQEDCYQISRKLNSSMKEKCNNGEIEITIKARKDVLDKWLGEIK